MSPGEFNGQVSVTVKGVKRIIDPEEANKKTADIVQAVAFCAPSQTWNVKVSACINTDSTNLKAFLKESLDKKAFEDLIKIRCKVDIKDGVTGCPNPTDFKSMDELYYALTRFMNSIYVNDHIVEHPDLNSILQNSIRPLIEGIERSELFHVARLKEEEYRKDLATRTGINIDSAQSFCLSRSDFRDINRL